MASVAKLWPWQGRRVQVRGKSFSWLPAAVSPASGSLRFTEARGEREAQTSAIVEAIVGWATRTFQEAPLTLSKRGPDGLVEVEAEHPMLTLLDQANPFYDGLLLQAALVRDLICYGNAYYRKVRSSGGRPVELWWQPAASIAPKWPSHDPSIFISHYELVASRDKVAVEDIIHFRLGLDPDNVRLGRSPLRSLLRELWTDAEAARTTATLLANQGVPGLIISPGNGAIVVDENAAEELKRRVQERTTGERRGEPFVASAPVDVSQFGFSPDQMNLRELRWVPEERACAATGVNPTVLQLGAGLNRSTFSNMAEAREAAYESFIIPLQRMYAAVLKRQLLRDFVDEAELGQWVAGFDLSQIRVLQEDATALSNRMTQQVVAGIRTVASAKAALGDEVLPGDDVYLRPFSTLVVPAGQDATTEEPDDTDEGKGWRAKAMTRRQMRLLRMLAEDERVLAGQWERRLTALFRDLGKRAGQAWLASAAPDGKGRKDSVADEVLRMLGLLRLDAWEEDEGRPVWEAHYDAVARQTFAALGPGVVPDAAQDALASRILAAGGKRLGLLDLQAQTRQRAFNAIDEGRMAGESNAQIARRIEDVVGAGPWQTAQVRAQVVSRTETKYAQVASTIEALGQNPAVANLMLVDAQLGPTDAECEFRNGRVVTAEEARAELEKEHPNGGLSVVPVVM